MNRTNAIVVALSLLLPAVAPAAPQPMTRDEIIGLAQLAVGYSYWWGHGRWRSDGTDHGSCSGNCPSCSHSGNHGADCSGLAAKVWQVPDPVDIDVDSHPYSTSDFRWKTTHWTRVDRSELVRGDALVYRNSDDTGGHIVVYESGDGWGSHWVYECKGCSYGCVHNLRTSSSAYIGIRRNNLDERPQLAAEFVAQGADVDADPTGQAQLAACAGQTLNYWFELRDTGVAGWSDSGGIGWGQAVRLGVPGDTADPLTGVARLSLSANANSSVSSGGGDCNDAPGCQRTVFHLTGTAPATPGVVKSQWQLVDEGRSWFGPTMYLTFNVADCAPPAGPDAGTPPVEPGPDAGAEPEIVPADAGAGQAALPDSGMPVSDVPAPGSAATAVPSTVESGCGCSASAAPVPLVLLALAAVGATRRRR